MKNKIIVLLCLSVAMAFFGCSGKEEETVPSGDKIQLADYITGGSFGGSYDAEKGRYKDAWQINYDLELIPDATYKVWNYSYKATLDGTVVAEEENINAPFTSIFRIEMVFDEPLETGHFVITIYDEDGNAVNTGECDIVKSPPPTIADFLGFHVNPGESFVLPGTDITFSLPGGYSLSDDYLQYNDQVTSRSLFNSIVMYASYDTEDEAYSRCGIIIYYMGSNDLEEFDVEGNINDSIGDRRAIFDAYNIEYEEEITEYELGGYECRAGSISTATEAEGVYPVSTVVTCFGDYDTVYMMVATSPEDDLVHTVINSLR